MVEIKVENIVASIKFADKLDLDMMAQSLERAEFNHKRFPGLIHKIENPKTSMLLFRSGKAICAGANNIKDIQKAVSVIACDLRNIGMELYQDEDFKIVIQNIVATASLKGELNLSEAAVGLGLENVEYEPEQFPGLVYRMDEPRVVILIFSSGKIVCTGGKKIEDVQKAIEKLSEKLILEDLIH